MAKKKKETVVKKEVLVESTTVAESVEPTYTDKAIKESLGEVEKELDKENQAKKEVDDAIEKILNTIIVGVGGRGNWPLRLCKPENGFQIVGLCDIDLKAISVACDIATES